MFTTQLIDKVMSLYYLSRRDVARMLAVEEKTVHGWVSGETDIVGLPKDVLQALYASGIAMPPQSRLVIGARLPLGIGAVIHQGLLGILRDVP